MPIDLNMIDTSGKKPKTPDELQTEAETEMLKQPIQKTRAIPLESIVAGQDAKAAEDEKGVFTRLAEGAQTLVFGDSTRDLPEFGNLSTKELGLEQGDVNKIGNLFLLEPTVEGKKGILQKIVPEARFDIDDNENVIVELPNGAQAYINKSGASMQDAVDVISQVIQFIPAAKIASLAAKGAPLLMRAGAQAIGASATANVAQQASQAAGSERKLTVTEQLMVPALAAGGEAILPIFRAMSRKMQSARSGGGAARARDVVADELDELRARGVDVGDLTDDEVASLVESAAKMDESKVIEIAKLTDEGADEATIARLIDAETLPESVPLSAGQATKRPSLLQMERDVPKMAGEVGEAAAKQADELFQAQREAIETNVDVIRSRWLGEADRMTPTEQMAKVQERLVTMRKAGKQAVSDAYEAAANQKAFIPSNGLTTMRGNVNQTARKFISDIDELPDDVVKFIDKIDNQRTLHTRPNKKGSFNLVAPRVKVMEDFIKSANTSYKNAPLGSQDREMWRQIGGTVRKQLEDYVDGALISGSDEAIAGVGQARAKARGFAKMFKERDVAERLVEKVGDTQHLKYNPDEAVNALFGMNKIAKSQTLQGVNKLKKILPPEEFAMVKDAAFMRIMKNATGADFNPKAFAKNLDKAVQESPELMKALFSQNDMKIIQQLRRVMTNVGDNKWQNHPNTASALLNLTTKLGHQFGQAGAAVGGVVQKMVSPATDAMKKSNFNRAIAGEIPQQIRGGVITPAVGGAMGTTEKGKQKQRGTRTPRLNEQEVQLLFGE